MQRKNIKLGERLETVKSFLSDIPENGCIADIGSDHGKLVCAYLEQHEGSRAIATDISTASLEKARILVKERGLSDRVSFREGNGLGVIKTDEVDAICFCGIGGEVIRDCLLKEFMNPDTLFVFQPMSGIEEIREFLYKNCFWIENDTLINEKHKYYQIFSGRFKTVHQNIPTSFPNDFWSIGYLKQLKMNDELRTYIEEKITTLNNQVAYANHTHNGVKLQKLLSNYEKALREFCI